VPPNPVYGGRYHWVVSGMASVMERDHRFLPIEDEGSYVLIQPIARNYDSLGHGTAPVGRDNQENLLTDVPDGQYGATASDGPCPDALIQAFEEGAIVAWDGDGMDHEEWVRGGGQGPADPDLGWIYLNGGVLYSKPPLDPPPAGEGRTVQEVLNGHQCHLVVLFTCWSGDEFRHPDSLAADGVDCVVAPGDALTAGCNVWWPVFWNVLRHGGTVQTGIDDAVQAVRDANNDNDLGTSTFRATAPEHRIVEPPKSAFYK